MACQHCLDPIDREEPRWLEWDQRAGGPVAESVRVPEERSQGMFSYHQRCAKIALGEWVPTAEVQDRTMTREEWRVLHRRARKRIRKGDMGMPSDGAVKSAYVLGDSYDSPEAFLKEFHSLFLEEENPGDEWAQPRSCFMTAHEEAVVYTWLPHGLRPWTVQLRNGWILQEACREFTPVPSSAVERLQALGIRDIGDMFNMGPSARDGGARCYDWGCLDDLQEDERDTGAYIDRRLRNLRRLGLKLQRNTYRTRV